MTQRRVTMHRRDTKGMSEAMANELNRQQAVKVQRKMGATHIRSPKVKQGYSPNRSALDPSTLG